MVANRAEPHLVDVRVELFGRARMTSGLRYVEVALPKSADRANVAVALAQACPELVGEVISEDGSGFQESYTLNVNGTTFVGDGPLGLISGDAVLLFSSQAGG